MGFRISLHRFMPFLILSLLLFGGCSGKEQTLFSDAIQLRRDQTEETWQPEKIVPDYVALARELVIKNYFEVALGQLDLAMESGVINAEVYFLRGLCLREIGRMEEAVSQFRKALSINDKYAPAYNGLGIARQKQGKLVKAIDAFRKAVDTDPAQSEYLNNRGYALLMKGQYKEAENSFHRALTVAPGYRKASNNLALCFGYQNRDSEAFKLLREHNPEIALRNMAIIYRILGKNSKAVEVEVKFAKLQKSKEYAEKKSKKLTVEEPRPLSPDQVFGKRHPVTPQSE